MRRMTALPLLLVLGLGACAATPAQQGASQKYVVFFAEWSANLDQPAQQVITAAANAAKKASTVPVIVAGYADPAGSSQANLDMSRTRAQVVVDQLVQDGVSPSRIQRTAHGPTDYTSSAQESRRVEIAVGS
jgi:outer membrane protein OmpA-like peptidoglycan-associated protein